MSKTLECDHCEKAKRTYKWRVITGLKGKGVACTYCDSVALWPKMNK